MSTLSHKSKAAAPNPTAPAGTPKPPVKAPAKPPEPEKPAELAILKKWVVQHPGMPAFEEDAYDADGAIAAYRKRCGINSTIHQFDVVDVEAKAAEEKAKAEAEAAEKAQSEKAKAEGGEPSGDDTKKPA